jgi:hypothetical protein
VDVDEWSGDEIRTFVTAIQKHEKDFYLVANEV